MLKEFGSYIASKVTKSVVGKAVKWGFWSLVLFCPGGMITAIGYQGIVISAVTVHSGIIEYGASSIVSKKIL